MNTAPRGRNHSCVPGSNKNVVLWGKEKSACAGKLLIVRALVSASCARAKSQPKRASESVNISCKKSTVPSGGVLSVTIRQASKPPEETSVNHTTAPAGLELHVEIGVSLLFCPHVAIPLALDVKTSRKCLLKPSL